MKISFENPDKVNGLLTLTVETADFQDRVEKTLKDLRKKAQLPGFRPGQVPMGMIKRQYGEGVKAEEINKIIGEELYKYVNENKIKMLGEPMANEGQEPVDLEKDAPYVFKFDIAVAPEFNVELTDKDTLDYYTIKVDDDLVNRQIDMFASRAGHYDKAEEYQANDMLKGDIRELDENGNTKEGGITVEGAVLMPDYIKVEDQKKLFEGCKLGDIITFNPKKAYPESDVEVSSLLKMKKEELAALDPVWNVTIVNVKTFVPATECQETYDKVFGKDAVKTTEEFDAKIAEKLEANYKQEADYRLSQDLRKYLVDKANVNVPEAFLKRWLYENNKEKFSKEDIEKEFDGFLGDFRWQLVRGSLMKKFELKVEDKDMLEAAKAYAAYQYAMYGMGNVPEELLTDAAAQMLKDERQMRNIEENVENEKVIAAVKEKITLQNKKISEEKFRELK